MCNLPCNCAQCLSIVRILLCSVLLRFQGVPTITRTLTAHLIPTRKRFLSSLVLSVPSAHPHLLLQQHMKGYELLITKLSLTWATHHETSNLSHSPQKLRSELLTMKHPIWATHHKTSDLSYLPWSIQSEPLTTKPPIWSTYHEASNLSHSPQNLRSDLLTMKHPIWATHHKTSDLIYVTWSIQSEPLTTKPPIWATYH